MVYEALIVDYAGTFTDPGVAEAVRRSRERGLRTALLSNADHVPHGLPDVFDVVVVSGEAGVGKPDPAAYRLVAERLGVAPRQCVFVDDVASYVHAAAAVGMTGVHHRRAEDTAAELDVLLRQ